METRPAASARNRKNRFYFADRRFGPARCLASQCWSVLCTFRDARRSGPQQCRIRPVDRFTSKACRTIVHCSTDCPFAGKILRDNFIRVRLVCPDNREGREKSALLRGQSLGRMRSRRGYSLPPETGNRSDAFKLQGLVPCIFFVQSSG